MNGSRHRAASFICLALAGALALTLLAKHLPEAVAQSGVAAERTEVAAADPAVCDELRLGRVPTGSVLVELSTGAVPGGHNGIDEAIVGTHGRDVVYVGDSDLFCGGGGSDTATALGGAPVVHGEAGRDDVRLVSGAAGHFFGGEDGDGDIVYYDALEAGVSTVFLSGNTAATTMAEGRTHYLTSVYIWRGSNHGDVVDASVSAHGVVLDGLAGDDVLIGSPFPDTIKTGLGDNRVAGLESKDHIHSQGGNDTIDGGRESGINVDILDLRELGGPVRMSFDMTGGIVDHPAGQTRFLHVRHILGTLKNDLLDGTNGPPEGLILSGSLGDDILVGTRGPDRLVGESGKDTCHLGDHVGATASCETVRSALTLPVGLVTTEHQADASRAAINLEDQFGNGQIRLRPFSAHALIAGFETGSYGPGAGVFHIATKGHNQGLAFLRDVEVDGQLYARVVLSASGSAGLPGIVMNAMPIERTDQGYEGDPGCCGLEWTPLVGYTPWSNTQFELRDEVNVRDLTSHSGVLQPSAVPGQGGYLHPGGIQAHGDFVAVAMESQKDGGNAGVYFLKGDGLELQLVGAMTLGGRVGEPSANVREASSVGFTKLDDGTFLLAVTGGATGVRFYRSTTTSLQQTSWVFLDFWAPDARLAGGLCDIENGQIAADCFIGASGTSLITNDDGTIYALFTHGTAGPGFDIEDEFLQVMRLGLDLDRRQLELTSIYLAKRQLGFAAYDNLSFRWSGSAQVRSDGQIVLATTKRLSRNNASSVDVGPVEIGLRGPG